MLRTLIIGGYGNFGGTIARALAGDPGIGLLISGRSREKAGAFAAGIGAEGVALDIDGDIAARLAALKPDLVIHTTGPFQGQDYRVARAAMACGAAYIDLADSRAFVAGIGALDAGAKAAGTAVISGASSVPCLTAAVIDAYRPHFARLDGVRYGISTAQKGAQGLATAAAVLSYVGKPFTALRNGEPATVHGWQDLHGVRYPEIGLRLFGNCDIPDLSLFPARYPGLRDLAFVAGHQVKLLHLGTWAMSWLVRGGLIRDLGRWAPQLLEVSRWFDPLGSDKSGFHMFLDGTGQDGAPKRVRFFLIARRHHGPHIPCVPAVVLARRMARGEAFAPGARPCLDLIDLPEYLGALAHLDIATVVEGAGTGPEPALTP